MKRMTRDDPQLEIPACVIQALAKMQDGLNCFIDSDWRSNRSLKDWALACTIESTELMDSYPWKWWKNVKGNPDFKNVRVELVDILHFALSGTMQMQSEGSRNCDSPIPGDIKTTIISPLQDTQNAIETFMNVISLAKYHKFDIITEMVIASAQDLSFNLVGYYIAKHTLNYIRQLGGYKDGTYVKVKQGTEDNELLHECIAQVDSEQVISSEGYVVAWDKVMQLVYDAFKVDEKERRTTSVWMNLQASNKKE
eukprot:Tbor_TRINITY_DN5732_c0_g2::TRINITY_DN5732_c0_g2_i4::g.19633::m.19633